MSLAALRQLRRQLDGGQAINGSEYDRHVAPIVREVFEPLTGSEALDAVNREWRGRYVSGQFPTNQGVMQLRTAIAAAIQSRLVQMGQELTWREPAWLREELEGRYLSRDRRVLRGDTALALSGILRSSEDHGVTARFPWNDPNRLRMKSLISEALRYLSGEESRLGWLVLMGAAGVKRESGRYGVFSPIDRCIRELEGELPAATEGDWSRKTLGKLEDILRSERDTLSKTGEKVRALWGIPLSQLLSPGEPFVPWTQKLRETPGARVALVALSLAVGSSITAGLWVARGGSTPAPWSSRSSPKTGSIPAATSLPEARRPLGPSIHGHLDRSLLSDPPDPVTGGGQQSEESSEEGSASWSKLSPDRTLAFWRGPGSSDADGDGAFSYDELEVRHSGWLWCLEQRESRRASAEDSRWLECWPEKQACVENTSRYAEPERASCYRSPWVGRADEVRVSCRPTSTLISREDASWEFLRDDLLARECVPQKIKCTARNRSEGWVAVTFLTHGEQSRAAVSPGKQTRNEKALAATDGTPCIVSPGASLVVWVTYAACPDLSIVTALEYIASAGDTVASAVIPLPGSLVIEK